jgi:hypothetical protein
VDLKAIEDEPFEETDPNARLEATVVGMERVEKEQGIDIGELTGPFGTRERPVQVPSALGYRVVGCQGKVLIKLNFVKIPTSKRILFLPLPKMS